MAFDPFESSANSIIAPAKNAYALSPSDTADLASATKAIYIGTGGDLAVRAIGDDSDVIFRNVPAGTVLAVRLRAVRATGTTASDLVGLA